MQVIFFIAINSVCLPTDKSCPPPVIQETCSVQPALKNLQWSPNLRLFQPFIIFLTRKAFFMIANLHVPCYTLSFVLCTLDIKNKLFSSSSIFNVFKDCYHITSQSDLLQTKQPPQFNLSSLVTFSAVLLIILVGLFWTLSNQSHPSLTLVPKIGEKRVQQENHIPYHADGTPVYISQYGLCFPHSNLNSEPFLNLQFTITPDLSMLVISHPIFVHLIVLA